MIIANAINNNGHVTCCLDLVAILTRALDYAGLCNCKKEAVGVIGEGQLVVSFDSPIVTLGFTVSHRSPMSTASSCL